LTNHKEAASGSKPLVHTTHAATLEEQAVYVVRQHEHLSKLLTRMHGRHKLSKALMCLIHRQLGCTRQRPRRTPQTRAVRVDERR
jgi:hypothetical protein